MDPKQIFSTCVHLLDTFDPSRATPDVHLSASLPPEGSDSTTIRQIVTGVTRQQKLLRVFLNALYHLAASSAARSDFRSYEVLAYLTFFRLDELGVAGLGAYLESLPPHRSAVLLRLVLNRDALEQWVIPGWNRFLDRAFVEKDLLARVERHRAALCEWLASAEAAAAGPAVHAEATQALRRAPTVPRAPKLTVPRPRVPPEPLRIATGFTAKRVPSTLERTNLAEIERARAEERATVRAATLAAYGPAGPTAPKLIATRSNIDKLRAEVAAAREAEIGEPPRARAPPPLPDTGADVRMTVAALLREDAVFKSKQAAEAAALEDYEATLRDTSDYDAWRKRELERDAAAERAAVEARRVEALAAKVAAAAAVKAMRRSNDAVGIRARAAAAIVEEHVSVERAGEVAARAAVAAQVRAVEYVRPAEEAARIVAEKKVEAERVRLAREADEAALAAARVAESQERATLVLQLRAAEKVPRPYDPALQFDRTAIGAPAKDPDAGIYFEAMSLVELRERLALRRAREAEETDARRRSILTEKREIADRLRATAEAVAARRVRAAVHARSLRGDARAEALANEAAADAAHDAAVLRAADALAAADAMAADARAVEAARAKTAAETVARIAARFSDVEPLRLADRVVAQSRSAASQQEAVSRAAALAVAVRAKDSASKCVVESRAREAAAAEAKRAALALSTARAEEEAFRVTDAATRKSAFFRAADRERELSDALASTNVYASAQSKRARDLAREMRHAPTLDAERTLTASRRLERRE